jgi:transglutaminase-like putative cysteine protease
VRFDIRYRTTFTYDRPVIASHNELRACPVTDHRQRLITYRVSVDPSTRVLSSMDYWGTRVDAFGVREPHQRLEVVAEATVETHPSPLVTVAPTMADLHEPTFADEHAEYLERTRHTDWGHELAGVALTTLDTYGPDLVGVVLGLHRRIRTEVQYDPSATEIGVTVDEAWRGRAGVCQDYAHIAVAMCRAIGIPARYVSGYLFSTDDASAEETDAESVEVQTHAWFEAAIPGAGWMALDPTNGRDVGSRHVVVGRGRDYDDVAPFSGAHAGSAAVTLDASVDIRRGEMPTGVVPIVDPTAGPPGSSTPPPPLTPTRLSGPDPRARAAVPRDQAHQPDRTVADLQQQQQQQ